ncbi:MAG: hypothetical protein ABGY72_25140 [bacterium]
MRSTRFPRCQLPGGLALAMALQVCGLVGAPEDVHAQPGTVEHVATVAGGAVVVHAAGSLAVTADGNTLKVLDLSTPESPVTRGTLTLTDRIWDLVVDHDRAYVANGFVGFVVVDLADPDAPTVRGSYEVVSQGQTVSIALADNVVLTTNNQTGLNAFDVSDPTSPRLLTSWLTGGYSRDVAGMGTLGLVADQPDGLHVVNLSDPSNPLEASVHFAEGETTQLVVSSPATATAFIVDGATSTVEIVDLTDPTSAALAGTYTAPGRVMHVAAEGSTLFLAQAGQGLSIVDVSTPSAPHLTASYDTPGAVVGIALLDDLILVADTEALLVLRHRP